MRQNAREDGPDISRRVRALLASALMFGTALTGTLAAWSDSEITETQFEAGTFALVSRTDTGEFTTNGADGVATLIWPLAVLFPGQSTAAWVQIQSSGTVDGSVLLSGVQLAGDVPVGSAAASLRDALVVRVSASVSTDPAPPPCTVSTPGLEVTGLGLIPVVPAQPVQRAGGNTVTFCIVVILPLDAPIAAQGAVLSPTWSFTGSTG